MQVFYTVRPGDTVSRIAKRWELPIASLIAANNLSAPYTIYPGQQLSIPPGVTTYRVQPGDSVYRIAQFYGVPPSVIIEANRLRPPYQIQPGQLLQVPPGVPYYVVQPGDTLFEIARRYNVTTNRRPQPELIRQVNRLPSTDIQPEMRLRIPYAPPGMNGWIAYTSNRGGSFDIWLYDPQSGANVQLTRGLADSHSIPYWSPDSKKIAFVGLRGIIYVTDLVTGQSAQIDQVEPFTYLDWSPDSQRISYGKENQIVLYNPVSHSAQTINQQNPSDVQWFPSGAELLFEAPDESGNSQIYRIRTDGTGKEQLTRHTNVPHNHLRLSPDGTFFLYTTPGVSISIINTHDLVTGNAYTLTGGPLAKNYFPEWSPDSSRISYSATAFEERGYYSLIQTDSRTGDNIRTWAISDCFGTPVSWSPDGMKIAYLSGCDGTDRASEIWMIDLRHPVPILLVSGAQIASLAWSTSRKVDLPRKIYQNPVYRVTFTYPAHWQKVTEERYEGPDGFFQIGAIAGGADINDVCRSEAFHRLRPYGSNPRIVRATVQQQEACFIYPSTDQPAEMRGQAAMIVRYPVPVQIGDTTYNYFILWADQNHLNQLVQEFRFINRQV